LIIAGAVAPATDFQCYIILKGAAKSLTPLRRDFQELNSAITEYLEQSTPLGYSTIFKNMGTTLHIYTQLSKP
jgi:hypothetical protein